MAVCAHQLSKFSSQIWPFFLGLYIFFLYLFPLWPFLRSGVSFIFKIDRILIVSVWFLSPWSVMCCLIQMVMALKIEQPCILLGAAQEPLLGCEWCRNVPLHFYWNYNLRLELVWASPVAIVQPKCWLISHETASSDLLPSGKCDFLLQVNAILFHIHHLVNELQ